MRSRLENKKVCYFSDIWGNLFDHFNLNTSSASSFVHGPRVPLEYNNHIGLSISPPLRFDKSITSVKIIKLR